jgi:uncharacterized protein YndB with AHSA1/START domain
MIEVGSANQTLGYFKNEGATVPERIITMPSSDFSTTFTVNRTPEEVFSAINNVRGWWSGTVEGDTDALGSQFTYRYEDVHYTKQKITEFVPNSRVVWHIEDAFISFTEDPDEWTGTDVTFEVRPVENATELRFTHRGLVPEFECFDACSSAWGFYINKSLHDLIVKGRGDPNVD